MHTTTQEYVVACNNRHATEYQGIIDTDTILATEGTPTNLVGIPLC